MPKMPKVGDSSKPFFAKIELELKVEYSKNVALYGEKHHIKSTRVFSIEIPEDFVYRKDILVRSDIEKYLVFVSGTSEYYRYSTTREKRMEKKPRLQYIKTVKLKPSFDKIPHDVKNKIFRYYNQILSSKFKLTLVRSQLREEEREKELSFTES